jgi:putative ABC transport system substrate-binding protein
VKPLTRRALIAAGLCAPAAAWAQARPALVGVLVSTGLSPLDYLRDGMRALGYVEGRDLNYAFRSADGNPRDLPRLARHLASLDVAVLFCAGPAAVDAAVHATSRIPIVALDLETDPLRSGLVRSLQRPETNVTGLFLDQPRFVGKWFELVRQVLPKARQLNLLWDASTGPWQLAAAKDAARRGGFDTDTLVVRDEGEFDAELASGMARSPDALVLMSSPLVRARSVQLAQFCASRKLPAISPFSEFAQAGGLMSYGPDVRDYYKRAAVFVDKILKGSRPGDLALALPDQFRQVINLGAARELGLVVPQPVLAGASEVIG